MYGFAQRLVAVVAAGIAIAAVTSRPAGAAPSHGGLVRGTVTGVDGRPAVGARVVLRAWPRAAILDSAPAGPVGTPVVATAVTDANGSYALSPDLSSLGARFREAGGAISFSEEISDRAGNMTANDLSLAARTAPDATLPSVGSAAEPVLASFDLSRGSATVGVGRHPARSFDAPVRVPPRAVRAASAAHGPADATGGAICAGWSKTGASYAPQRERFYNLYSYGRVEVDEQSGSSHSLGVAYEGAGGGWGADAAIVVSTSASTGGDVGYRGNHTIYNEVNEHKFDQTCHAPPPGSPCKCPPPPSTTWRNHEIRATSFHDLQTDAPAIMPRAWTAEHACTPRTKGRFTKTSGADQEFSVGLSTPVGISVEARAGYSHNYSVTWTVTKGKGEWMCGSTSAGFAGAPFAGGTDPRPTCDSPRARTVRSEDGDDAPLRAATPATPPAGSRQSSTPPPVCG